jgi:cell division protein FtsB
MNKYYWFGSLLLVLLVYLGYQELRYKDLKLTLVNVQNEAQTLEDQFTRTLTRNQELLKQVAVSDSVIKSYQSKVRQLESSRVLVNQEIEILKNEDEDVNQVLSIKLPVSLLNRLQ